MISYEPEEPRNNILSYQSNQTTATKIMGKPFSLETTPKKNRKAYEAAYEWVMSGKPLQSFILRFGNPGAHLQPYLRAVGKYHEFAEMIAWIRRKHYLEKREEMRDIYIKHFSVGLSPKALAEKLNMPLPSLYKNIRTSPFCDEIKAHVRAEHRWWRTPGGNEVVKKVPKWTPPPNESPFAALRQAEKKMIDRIFVTRGRKYDAFDKINYEPNRMH